MSLQLIDKQDTSEIVRDQIGAVLLAETANQQALATAATKDPRLWTWRVFSERVNPWSDFLQTADPANVSPIIHVAIDSIRYDKSRSNMIEQQQCEATYHIDCYGYGVAADVFGGGHVPGDEAASLEAQRAARLIRNVLMSAENIQLQLPGTVIERWTESIQVFHTPVDQQSAQQIAGARITFQVSFNEYSPQIQGQIIESVNVTIKRAETGEVYLVADFPH